MVSYLTVAVPSPEDMCEPVDGYCSSSPRYLIDLISQLFALTVKIRALLEPASTVIRSPFCDAPKAISKA
jgi:hypothetical protein